MQRQSLVNLFLVLLSVTGYALAMPHLNWYWLGFVCLIPLFYVLERADAISKTILYGLVWGIGVSFFLGYWVFLTLLNHYELPFAKSLLFFSLCLVMPVAGLYAGLALLCRFFRRQSLVYYALILPSIWVGVEYAKTAAPFLLPWGGLDSALIGFTEFAQIADITGSYGIIGIAVAINAIIFFSLKKFFVFFKQRRSTDLIGGGFSLVAAGILVAIPFVYGRYQLKSIQASILPLLENPGMSIHATLVQGNFGTRERWSGMGFYQRIGRYLEMSGENGQQGRRVIVWPENTLNVSSKLDDALFIELMHGIGENALLIAGGLKTDADTGAVFNSAYFISGAGRLTRYDKQILLPYAETSPLFDLLDHYYTAPSEFSEGKTPLCIDASPGPAGPSICFEILYPGFIRKSVRGGAGYLVNLSNDSWFGDSPMPWVHLNAARMRAIENRRFLLRTSTSGISAVIGPDGHPMVKSRLFAQERVDGDFLMLDSLSFYTRFGDWVILAALGIILIALFRMVLRDDRDDF